MQYIPAIYFRKNKIKTGENSEEITIKDLINNYQDQKQLYLFDYDGITKNRPNLCSYPKISKSFEIWIDSKPEVVGDIVDYVLSGGQNIVIRQNLMKYKNIDHIKDITENKIFGALKLEDIKDLNSDIPDFEKYDGFIIFNSKEQIEKNHKIRDVFNKIKSKKDIYVYEQDEKNKEYWEKIEIKGMIVDLENI